jgi:hypothetical protein
MNNPENRLWATAVQLAGEAGMEYTIPCSRNVCDLITAGVMEMSREGRVSEEDWERADTSLSKLIREMILATRELGSRALSGGKIKIREAALVQSKKLCPLWPFG